MSLVNTTPDDELVDTHNLLRLILMAAEAMNNEDGAAIYQGIATTMDKLGHAMRLLDAERAKEMTP